MVGFVVANAAVGSAKETHGLLEHRGRPPRRRREGPTASTRRASRRCAS
jgi:hypothetical protein